jgi:outer membrane protein assembly factor BamA
VKVEGLTRTKESLVRRQVGLKPGAPTDPRELARVEQRVLALGVFSRTSSSLSPESPTTLTLDVQEDARLFGGYAVRYDDDRGIDYQLDAELRNILGYGLALGGTYRYSSEIEERRGSLQIPALPAIGALTFSFSRLREVLPQDNRRISHEFRVQETKKLPGRWDLLLGYRYRRVNLATQDIGEFVNDLSGMDLSVVRDTRDSFMNPRKGGFWSVSLSYSPEFLGGELNFIKGFAQAFLARPVRASLVWAQGYRIGLAHGFGGQSLDCLERFSAGGANSVRGYATNSLGPPDVFCGPRGNALVVVNQELRYAHRSGLGGAVFYDAGNVFAGVSSIRAQIRHSLGVGLRWDSPVGLLRLDVGFPLNRRPADPVNKLPEDKSIRYFFSLGQAF